MIHDDDPTSLLVSYCSYQVSHYHDCHWLMFFQGISSDVVYTSIVFFFPFSILETFSCESECHFGNFSGFDAL